MRAPERGSWQCTSKSIVTIHRGGKDECLRQYRHGDFRLTRGQRHINRRCIRRTIIRCAFSGWITRRDGPKPISMTEVEATIAKIADGQSTKYNQNESIVDLMKLLKRDSGLDARKQLAQGLGYTGALTGSADMNIWLHKEVMAKLAESGGMVPDSLKHA